MINNLLQFNHRFLLPATFLAALSFDVAARASEIHVPQDHPTIQQAIDVAADNSEIIVAPGMYEETIDFLGKSIHLQSSDGPEETVIDASGLGGSVVTAENGEGPDTILEGFTITGGDAGSGGGMYNFAASPTVVNVIFADNSATNGGAVANESGAEPVFQNCVFENNSASNDGGALHNIFFSTATVEDSLFAGNTSSSTGGAVWNSPGTLCNTHVSGTTFCENSPDDISGTWHDGGGNDFPETCPVDIPGDLTGDGQVGGADLGILLSQWGECADPDDCPADLTGSGTVGGADLGILLSNWTT